GVKIVGQGDRRQIRRADVALARLGGIGGICSGVRPGIRLRLGLRLRFALGFRVRLRKSFGIGRPRGNRKVGPGNNHLYTRAILMSASGDAEDARAREMRHGQVCYLQIPAVDLMQSAEFYEKLFGWQIERPYPSFESPGLIGQWVTDRPPAADA